MNGWLIVNSFLDSEKYSGIYSMLLDAARSLDIGLTCIRGSELVAGHSGYDKKPDFVLFWDKDIYLARLLEQDGIPVFNGSRAIALCDNKAFSGLCLMERGIAVPETLFAPKSFENIGFTDLSFIDAAAKKLGLPFVIKEVYGSFGQQVYLAKSVSEARKIAGSLHGRDFIMQRFISESSGRDVRVNVIGGKAVCAMLRQGAKGEFRSNISSGGSGSAFEPDSEISELAVRTCEAVGCDFAGVDILLGKDRALVCEINSNPHFKSTLEYTGVNLAPLIIKHVIRSVQ